MSGFSKPSRSGPFPEGGMFATTAADDAARDAAKIDAAKEIATLSVDDSPPVYREAERLDRLQFAIAALRPKATPDRRPPAVKARAREITDDTQAARRRVAKVNALTVQLDSALRAMLAQRAHVAKHPMTNTRELEREAQRLLKSGGNPSRELWQAMLIAANDEGLDGIETAEHQDAALRLIAGQGGGFARVAGRPQDADLDNIADTVLEIVAELTGATFAAGERSQLTPLARCVGDHYEIALTDHVKAAIARRRAMLERGRAERTQIARGVLKP